MTVGISKCVKVIANENSYYVWNGGKKVIFGSKINIFEALSKYVI